jgi:radical SAM superfamily enzyme YgiQ (UPF0313 family)
VDAILSGQGDKIVVKYLEHITAGKTFEQPSEIWRDNIPVYEAPKTDPDWDFAKSQTIYTPEDQILPGETLVIEVGRGCIFQCGFCSYPLNGKKKLDYIKYTDVLHEELMRNYNDHGITNYVLSDDTFNDSLDKMHILKEVFTNLPFRFTFSSYARLDLLNAHREEIEMFEEMGMVGVNFGVETFHEKASRTIGKGMVGKIAKDFLHELKTVHWKNRIKVGMGLIQGLPYETLESHEETRRWILDENNHVEQVKNHALSVVNPARDMFPYKSEFQLNATKYGFYWPNSMQHGYWKNLNGPVTDYNQAVELTKRANQACKETYREQQGGFGISLELGVAKYASVPKTHDELIAMDRFENNKWLENEGGNMMSAYVGKYKARL